MGIRGLGGRLSSQDAREGKEEMVEATGEVKRFCVITYATDLWEVHRNSWVSERR